MEVVVYTDGSHDTDTHIAASGFIVLHGTKSIKHEVTLLDGMTAFHSEIKAICLALQYCFLLKEVSHIICYTEITTVAYGKIGIKSKNPFIDELIKTVEIIKDFGVEIEFRYVKAHSGDRYNSIVDISVRKALRDYLRSINGKEVNQSNAAGH